MLVALAALPLAALGCRHLAAVPALDPARLEETVGSAFNRGSPWQEGLPERHVVQAGQLVIHADFGLAEQHRLIRDLETLRTEVSQDLGLPISDEPVHLYLFSDTSRYDTFAARYFPNFPVRRAFFVETDTTLAVFAPWQDRIAEDLRHETTHGYVHAVVPTVPLWLDEGIAEPFELPRGSDGIHPQHVAHLGGRFLEGTWRLDLARLESLASAGEMSQDHYAESWAWVHWLLHTTPRREEDRSNALAERNVASISESELDQAHFTRVGMEAEIVMAEAAIEQAEANLDTSEANLGYTKILAPVAGIIIDRKVELGQTLAAQFQTPELFVIAPDMRREMRIFASVDEADIGQIRLAQESGKSVQFSVDAYPGEVFEGKIAQIRLASTTTQNVVTYPVVLSTPNPELKLLPGMTAEISFQVDRRDGVIKVPNAALRFYPVRDHVREADRVILDGTALEADDQARGESPSASAKAEAEGERKRRHVWVVEADGLLRGIPVTPGIGDHRATEIVSGNVEPGQRLVVGIAPKDD